MMHPALDGNVIPTVPGDNVMPPVPGGKMVPPALGGDMMPPAFGSHVITSGRHVVLPALDRHLDLAHDNSW